MKSSTILALAAASGAMAARPANMSICDYYTTALLKQNTAKNQETLLTLVVNTAVIGNYTKPNVGIAVPGILTPGMYKGTKVNLLPYFDGMLESTNTGKKMGVSLNFLDGGGAAPLKMNMPASDTTSNQYLLLTHLYEYFAGLLECSMFGKTVMPYDGETSMYETHKYMALDEAEFAYFVTQVGLSAASFGVAIADVKAVGMALNMAFGYRCAPAAAIPPTAKPHLQAICIADDCPKSPEAMCSLYEAVEEPMTASMPSTSTMGGGSGGGSGGGMPTGMPTASGGSGGGGSMTSAAPSMQGTGAAPANVAPVLSGIGAGLFGVFAMFL